MCHVWIDGWLVYIYIIERQWLITDGLRNTTKDRLVYLCTPPTYEFTYLSTDIPTCNKGNVIPFSVWHDKRKTVFCVTNQREPHLILGR